MQILERVFNIPMIKEKRRVCSKCVISVLTAKHYGAGHCGPPLSC